MQAAGQKHLIYGSRSDRFKIWNLSDIHLMNKACAERVLKQDIRKIRDDPYSFWLGGGDYCDFIGYTDKRFDPDSVASWVNVKDLGRIGKVGMERIGELFDPIKHKCLGLILGNHELKFSLMTQHETLHEDLCDQLGVANLGYCAIFDIVFCRVTRMRKEPYLQSGSFKGEVKSSSTAVRCFAHHGAGYATTPGGKMNKIIQFMNSFRADLFFLGHCHDQIARREPVLGANKDCTALKHWDRIGVMSGSYLRTYAPDMITYGEQRGYRPVTLGAAGVSVLPETREMWAQV